MFWVFLLMIFGVTGNVNAEVYRCGNTYSESPCSGGRVIDASPAVRDEAGPSTKLIYLCRAPDGGNYWIPNPCSTRRWSMEGSERVPVDVSWQDQVRAARRQNREADAASAAPPPRVVRESHEPSKAIQCKRLDDRVSQLDSMGRAGSQHFDLDWVRSERKRARDSQFRLHC